MIPSKEKRHADGLCVTCGRKVEAHRTGRTRCQRCNDRIVEAYRQRRYERQAQGLCVVCGKAPAMDKKADSLCWSCDKSGYGCTSKCPWERSWQPVPGWDADYNEKSGGYGVKACPLYKEMDVTRDRLAQAAVYW